MESKETHYHTSGSDGGGSGAMIGLIAGIVLVALGAFLWFGMSDRGSQTASGPSVTVNSPPATTGQGGGGGGGGGGAKK